MNPSADRPRSEVVPEHAAHPGPEVTEDPVTYASWESFPASDAPSGKEHVFTRQGAAQVAFRQDRAGCGVPVERPVRLFHPFASVKSGASFHASETLRSCNQA